MVVEEGGFWFLWIIFWCLFLGKALTLKKKKRGFVKDLHYNVPFT